ncbi:MAG: hypothetical protein JWM53_6179 [bacterium]|nr:hypothetical protein [bacterium]
MRDDQSDAGLGVAHRLLIADDMRLESVESFDSQKLARLLAALEAVEGTESLIDQVRQGETFLSARREIRDAADRLSEVRDLLRTVIVAERRR